MTTPLIIALLRLIRNSGWQDMGLLAGGSTSLRSAIKTPKGKINEEKK